MIPGSANALLLASAAAAEEGISRSLRFNSADSAYLSRTPASAGNRKTWTWAGWVKRSTSGSAQAVFGEWDSGASNGLTLWFQSTHTLVLQDYGPGLNLQLTTSQVFRDFSAWFHLLVAVDTTQSTDTNRVKLYINGIQVTAFSTSTYPSQNYDCQFNRAQLTGIGRSGAWTSSYYLDGYLADVHFIDGQALDPTSFGEPDATTGVWNPIAYTGSYGTNGFHLDFADNSTAAALGTDTSGNGNTWTVNNISVTAGAGNDSVVDVPTNGAETDTGVGGEVRGNYCTWNPLDAGATPTLSNGNLDITTPSASGYHATRGTIAVSTGKWYFEFVSSTSETLVGIMPMSEAPSTFPGNTANSYGLYLSSGNLYKFNNGSSTLLTSGTTGDVQGIAFDLDGGTITYYKNGASIGSFTGLNTSLTYAPAIADGVSGGTASGVANFGQRPFAYTAPSGFKALCTANLPAPVVTKPSEYMDVKLYTGNGSTQTVSGLLFSPDLVWIKCRSSAEGHSLHDAVRGATSYLQSNNTNAEATSSNTISAFTSDGFSVGSSSNTNLSSATFAAWTWDAGSSTVTNTDGSITSSVRANASAGFSVVTWTSNGNSSVETMGHGLGVTPGLIIAKNRSISGNWWVWHSSFSNQVRDYLLLQTTDAKVTAGVDVWSTSSTTFGIRQATIANNTNLCVAYCFAPVDGYASMSSFVGNGSTDGPFCFTGFRPRFLLLKASSGTSHWHMMDTSREPYNQMDTNLFANLSNAELTDPDFRIDFLSNGFKLRTSGPSMNGSGTTYIWAAWAENPFQYARAR